LLLLHRRLLLLVEACLCACQRCLLHLLLLSSHLLCLLEVLHLLLHEVLARLRLLALRPLLLLLAAEQSPHAIKQRPSPLHAPRRCCCSGRHQLLLLHCRLLRVHPRQP
jgi:hypothetical protein